MRYCNKCKRDLPLHSFQRANKKKSGYQSACRECTNRDHAVYRRKNPELTKACVKAAREKTMKVKQLWIDTYLQTNHCPCGESRRCCLQFDHIDPTKKKDDVGRLVRSGCSLSTLKAEVEKTRVLCANCHCVRTSIQFGWYQGRKAG